MSVDVIYQDLPIAQGAPVRVEGAGLFIEMEAPMPVATRLTLVYEDRRLEGRVRRIHEGVGAGVLLVPEGPLPKWVHKMRPTDVQTMVIEAEPEPVAQAPVAQAPAAPVAQARPVVQAAPSAVTPEAEAEPEGDGEAPLEAAALPPPETTQEMLIPSLDDEPKAEGDDPPSSARRGARKKKPSRRR